jgi:hypothetical protein
LRGTRAVIFISSRATAARDTNKFIPRRVRSLIDLFLLLALESLDSRKLTAEVAAFLKRVFSRYEVVNRFSQVVETHFNMVVHHIKISVIIIILFMLYKIFREKISHFLGLASKYVSVFV